MKNTFGVSEIMDTSWGLNIDIEGFSNLYESNDQSQSRAKQGLGELMKSIIQIGVCAYPDDDDRLFAYQFGDGFIIVSEFAKDDDAGRCISIAAALMKHMLINGFATKAAISTGSMSDISGCYPDEIRNSENGSLPLGAGLMTTISVMGTALIKAHKLSGKASGNVLIVDDSQFSNIPPELVSKTESNLSFINWMSDKNDLAMEIAHKASLKFETEIKLRELFEKYIKTKPCPPQNWIEKSRFGNGT